MPACGAYRNQQLLIKETEELSIFMKRIKPAEGIAEPFDFVVANTIGRIELQVLCHPYLVTDSRVLVHLTITYIREHSTIRLTIGVHPFSRANDCRIKRIDRLIRSRGVVVRAGDKQYG